MAHTTEPRIFHQPANIMKPQESDQPAIRTWGLKWFLMTALIASASAFGIAMLLMTMFQRKSEAQNRHVRLVDVTENTTDPKQWGINWPRQYDSYMRTVDITHTRYGGSEGGDPGIENRA